MGGTQRSDRPSETSGIYQTIPCLVRRPAELLVGVQALACEATESRSLKAALQRFVFFASFVVQPFHELARIEKDAAIFSSILCR